MANTLFKSAPGCRANVATAFNMDGWLTRISPAKEHINFSNLKTGNPQTSLLYGN